MVDGRSPSFSCLDVPRAHNVVVVVVTAVMVEWRMVVLGVVVAVLW